MWAQYFHAISGRHAHGNCLLYLGRFHSPDGLESDVLHLVFSRSYFPLLFHGRMVVRESASLIRGLVRIGSSMALYSM